MVEEISRQLAGTWVLERSENVIEYLNELALLVEEDIRCSFVHYFRPMFCKLAKVPPTAARDKCQICSFLKVKQTDTGVGPCERKSFADDTATQTISITDDVIHLEMKFGKRHIKMDFKLDEEFEINAGKPSKAIASWKDGAMVIDTRRVECGRQQQVERKRDGEKLIQTMTSNGVSCRRIMRRLSADDT